MRFFARSHLTPFQVQLLERLDKMSATGDALTAAMATLATAANNVATEVASLNSGEDQTAMTNAISGIGTVVTQLNGLVPTPEAPPEGA